MTRCARKIFDLHLALAGAAAVVTSVLLQIFAQICPATSDTDHDSLATLTNAADEQLYGCLAIGPR